MTTKIAVRGWTRAATCGLLLMAGACLAGCESSARQDSLLVRPSSDAIIDAGMPMYRDRPIDENLRRSLELTDYRVALNRAGLLDRLREAGPFTVFAVANAGMEAEQSAAGGALLDPANHPTLRRLLGYDIVPGLYPPERLRRMIARAQGPVALRTLDPAAPITVAIDPASSALTLRDRRGAVSALSWITSRQSNGILYVSPGLPMPGDLQFASAAWGTGAPGAGGLDNSRFYVPGNFATGVGAPSSGAPSSGAPGSGAPGSRIPNTGAGQSR